MRLSMVWGGLGSWAVVCVLVVFGQGHALAADAQDEPTVELHSPQRLAYLELARLHGKDVSWHDIRTFMGDVVPGGLPEDPATDPVVEAFARSSVVLAQSFVDVQLPADGAESYAKLWSVMQRWFGEDATPDAVMRSGLARRLAFGYVGAERYADALTIYESEWRLWSANEVQERWATVKIITMLAKLDKNDQAIARLADYQLRREFVKNRHTAPNWAYWSMVQGARDREAWPVAAEIRRQHLLATANWENTQKAIPTFVAALSQVDPSIELGPWVGLDDDGVAWLDAVSRATLSLPRWQFSPDIQSRLEVFARDETKDMMARAQAYALSGDLGGIAGLMSGAEALSPQQFHFLCDVLVLTYGHPDVLKPGSGTFAARVADSPWAGEVASLLSTHDPDGEYAAAWRQQMRASGGAWVQEQLQRTLTDLLPESPDAVVTAVNDLRGDQSYVLAYIIANKMLNRQNFFCLRSIRGLEKSKAPLSPEQTEELAGWKAEQKLLAAALARLRILHQATGETPTAETQHLWAAALVVAGVEAMAEDRAADSAANFSQALQLAPRWLLTWPIVGGATLQQLEAQMNAEAFAVAEKKKLTEAKKAAFITILKRFRVAHESPSFGRFMALTGTTPRDLTELAAVESLLADDLQPAERDILRLLEAEMLAADGQWEQSTAILARYENDPRFDEVRSFYSVRRGLEDVILATMAAKPETMNAEITRWLEATEVERSRGSLEEHVAMRWTVRRLQLHAENPERREAAMKAMIVLVNAPGVSWNIVPSMLIPLLRDSEDLSPYAELLFGQLAHWPDPKSVDRIRDAVLAGAPGAGLREKTAWYLARAGRDEVADEQAVLVLHLASYLYERHEFQATLDVLAEDAVWSEDSSAHRLLLSGLCAYRSGDRDGAIKALAALRADYSESPYMVKASYLLGWIYAANGDIASARQIQQDVLKLAPKSELAGMTRLFADAHVDARDDIQLYCDAVVLRYGVPGEYVPSSGAYRSLVKDPQLEKWLAGAQDLADADTPGRKLEIQQTWLANDLRGIKSDYFRRSLNDAVDLVASLHVLPAYTPLYFLVYDDLQRKSLYLARQIASLEARKQPLAAAQAERLAAWRVDLVDYNTALQRLLALPETLDSVDAKSRDRVRAAHLMLDAYVAHGERRFTDALGLVAEAQAISTQWLQDWPLLRDMSMKQLEVQAACQAYNRANGNLVAHDKFAEYVALLVKFRAVYGTSSLATFLGYTGTQSSTAEALELYGEMMAAVLTPDEKDQLVYLKGRLVANLGDLEAAAKIWDGIKDDPRFADLKAYIEVRKAFDAQIDAAMAKDASTAVAQVIAWSEEHEAELKSGKFHDHMTNGWIFRRLREMAEVPETREAAITAVISMSDVPTISTQAVVNTVLPLLQAQVDTAAFVDTLYDHLLRWQGDPNLASVVDVIMAGAPGTTNAEKLAWYIDRTAAVEAPDDHSELLMHAARYLYRENEFALCKSLLEKDLKWSKSVQDNRLLIVGMIHYRTGNVEGALEAFSDLRKNFPKSPYRQKATFVAGWINASEGNLEEARALLEEVKTMDPDSEDAEKATRILLGIQP